MRNDKVNILIVEDENIVAMGLEDTLLSEGYQVAGMADNGRKALDIVRDHPPDLALLDIQINGDWDGVETARKLTEIQDIPFIFLTAFTDEETVSRARATTPSAYLIKPYLPRDLFIAIDLALHNFEISKNEPARDHLPRPGEISPFQDQKDDLLIFNRSFFIKQNYRFIKVNIDDITYLEADGNHTLVFTSEKKYIVRQALGAILDKLQDNFLLRIHRSFAINMQHLTAFNATSVFIDKKELPLSRHYKEDFLGKFD